MLKTGSFHFADEGAHHHYRQSSRRRGGASLPCAGTTDCLCLSWVRGQSIWWLYGQRTQMETYKISVSKAGMKRKCRPSVILRLTVMKLILERAKKPLAIEIIL